MKFLLNIVFIGFFCFPVMAQLKPDRIEKIDAARKSWINKKLNITNQEEKAFWPVYNMYQDNLKTLYRQKKSAKENSSEIPFDEINFDSKILEVRKKYKTEFLKILPQQKVIRLYQAEREFRDQLIRHLNKG